MTKTSNFNSQKKNYFCKDLTTYFEWKGCSETIMECLGVTLTDRFINWQVHVAIINYSINCLHFTKAVHSLQIPKKG